MEEIIRHIKETSFAESVERCNAGTSLPENTPEPRCHINNLPIEIISEIIYILDYVTSYRSRRVCTLWKDLIDHRPRKTILFEVTIASNCGMLTNSPEEPDVRHIICSGNSNCWLFRRFLFAKSTTGAILPKFPHLQNITFHKSQLKLRDFPYYFERLDVIYTFIDVYMEGSFDRFQNPEALDILGPWALCHFECLSVVGGPDLAERLWSLMDEKCDRLTVEQEELVIRVFPKIWRLWVRVLFEQREGNPALAVPGLHNLDLDTLRSLKPWTQQQLLWCTRNPGPRLA